MARLIIEPLARDTFAAYGDVIELAGDCEIINSDTVRKFADLAGINLSGDGGRPAVHIYQATPYTMPMTIRMLERHPLSSQLFMPLHGRPFLVVVAATGNSVQIGDLGDDIRGDIRAFITNGKQGVNYHAGTWHHPVIAINEITEFIELDRIGSGKNCDEITFDDPPITVDASSIV